MSTHILVLCTHNSARSVLAEGMLRHLAAQRGVDVVAHSAGSAPSGRVQPLALQVLQDAGVDIEGLHSKSWDRFAQDGGPPLAAVITVCDSAAGESCPYWPGHPVQVHWGMPDPAYIESTMRQRLAFEDVYSDLNKRLQKLAALDFDGLSDTELKAAAQAIHTTR